VDEREVDQILRQREDARRRRGTYQRACQCLMREPQYGGKRVCMCMHAHARACIHAHTHIVTTRLASHTDTVLQHA